MDDLQTMVDSLRFSEPVDGKQMDNLAGMLKNKLGLNLDQSAYRQLAENMVNLSISKNREHISHSLQRSSNQSNNQFHQNGVLPLNHNSSFSDPATSSFSHPNTGSFDYQNNDRRNNGDKQTMQSTNSVLSPNVTQRRGRSPIRTDNKSSNITSPVRQIFGGIPRGGVVLNSNNSVKPVDKERTRNVSPAPGPGFFNRSLSSEENKDNEKKEVVAPHFASINNHSSFPSYSSEQASQHSKRVDPFLVHPLRTDQSSGASQQKFPKPVGMKGQGRCHSPNPTNFYGSNVPNVPPCSPGYKAPLMRHSAPNSPSYSGLAVNTMPDRPPSRSGSPFNRPGLQESGGGVETISGRSPKREYETISFKPRVPLGHRRTQSSGVDADNESIQQPHIPRSFSKSPLRRTSAAPEQDSDSIRQPAPPRPSSHSPHRDNDQGKKGDGFFTDNFVEDVAAGIDMPDLSIPDFDPTTTTPFRFHDNNQNPFNRNPEVVHVNDVHQTAIGKLRRKDGTPFFDSPHQSDMPLHAVSDGDMTFRVGAEPSSRKVPGRRPIRRIDTNLDPPTRSDGFESRFESTPSPHKTEFSDRFATPMEVEMEDPEPEPIQFRVPHHRHPSLESHELEGMASLTGKIRSSHSHDGVDENLSSRHPSSESIHNNNEGLIDYTGMTTLINFKRDEARTHYLAGEYALSINAYTDAIKVADQHADCRNSDASALLLSNRAAALLMIGSFDASASDCESALKKIVFPRNKQEQFSPDSGLLLKIKLHTRKGRALLKLGDYNGAYSSFDEAIKTTEEAMSFSRMYHSSDAIVHNLNMLSQMNTEATLGQSDAKRLREACEKLTKSTLQSLKYPVDRTNYAEALGCVNMALSLASGSTGLSESKLAILSSMKRWREVAGFCERLAAFNVRPNNIFKDDLFSKNPFPGVPSAVHLKSNFFGNSREEDVATRDLKLPAKAAGEAVLRLPQSHIPFYLRALRLEERYPTAEAAHRSLEEYLQQGHIKDVNALLSFVAKERSKLNRTKQGRERGDVLFRAGDFELAAAQYTTCLTIDNEGITENLDGSNAGGRLHAVLHCNRAACLMALKRLHEAIEECSYALKIHSRYMKAILRRARCYARLQQLQEGISEYKRWLELVEEASKPNYAASISSPCLFDGPSDVKPVEVSQVKKELDELCKAKLRAEATSREEAERRRVREKWQENFSSSWRSAGDAQQRREQWFDQQDGHRRWDSFKSEGPRSRSHSRPRTNDEGIPNSHSAPQPQVAMSPRSDSSRDHYAILNIPSSANMEVIKRAFRKLAVKYHPDKNKEEGATENFLRIKLAHDTLSDPVKRVQYDSELRRMNRY